MGDVGVVEVVLLLEELLTLYVDWSSTGLHR